MRAMVMNAMVMNGFGGPLQVREVPRPVAPPGGVVVRVLGERTKILLSDITAATDWPIAKQAVEGLELPLPDDDDDQAPAGDLSIVADLGMGAMDMGALLDDVELYPDEMLADIATRLGFGALYDQVLGVATP